MKTINLEEIFADPHVLEPLLAGEEAVELLRKGLKVGTLRPSKSDGPYVPTPMPKPTINFAARFLAMHGPMPLRAHGQRPRSSTSFDARRH